MPKRNAVAADVKKQILDRVRNEGAHIPEIAKEHGLSPNTVYGWLSKGATAAPSWLELNKLKRENSALKELLGRVMLEIELSKKKN